MRWLRGSDDGDDHGGRSGEPGAEMPHVPAVALGEDHPDGPSLAGTGLTSSADFDETASVDTVGVEPHESETVHDAELDSGRESEAHIDSTDSDSAGSGGDDPADEADHG